MAKKIMILGASRYYSRSIEATRDAGYYVIAVDRSPDSIGFQNANQSLVCDIVNKVEILRLAQQYSIDAIIPVNDYGVPTAAYVSEKMGLLGVSIETAELATNKELMRKKWLSEGIGCPKFFVADDYEQLLEGISHVGLPCILKPAHGIGGASRGIIVIREPEEIEQAIKFSQGFYQDQVTLIESFVEAVFEHSVEVLIYNGVPHIIAVSDKKKSPLPYRVDKNVIYPTAVKGDSLADLKKNVREAITALGIEHGAAHVELASTKDGFVLFELGARCGGGGTPEPIVPYVSGIQEFVETVRILAGDRPHQLTPVISRGCDYRFLMPPKGLVRSVNGLDAILGLEKILDAELFTKSGSIIPEVTVGTDRSGFIIAGGETREDALKLGEYAESLIQIEYESV
jgi:biotin carboxylase